VLVGDPAKPGLYVVLQKELPHNNSRPHFHPNDRYITVISGTWWVNTGPKYDPAGFTPVPAGSFVVHTGKEIHYDGAKDEECILQIVGIGPATATQVEDRFVGAAAPMGESSPSSPTRRSCSPRCSPPP
jgi:hypothetical protein